VSFHKPIYAKFKYEDAYLEGEYIPMWTDYFSPKGCDDNPLTKPGIGFLRPFDRDYRQLIINRNMNTRGLDYYDWMNLGDVVECDAFITVENRSAEDSPLLIDKFEIVSREEISTDQKNIDLCRKDIVHRMIVLSKNMKNYDQELIKNLEKSFYEIKIQDYSPLCYKRKISIFSRFLGFIYKVIEIISWLLLFVFLFFLFK
jgi:hypothetical protein